MQTAPTNLEAVSDQALFNALVEKQEWALSVLYDRHAPNLYGLALKILKDPPLAEDLLQELMLFLWQNADKFDASKGSPLAWMMILCRNRAIDKLRSQQRKRQRSAPGNEQSEQKYQGDESETPLEIVIQIEQQNALAEGFKQLPDEQRQLIELAYFGGLSQSEISEELNLPLGTVKTRIRLGMQKLREILKRNQKS